MGTSPVTAVNLLHILGLGRSAQKSPLQLVVTLLQIRLHYTVVRDD